MTLETERISNLSPKKILAVDDEASTLDVIAQALEVLGYQTITAGDGEEACQVIEKHKPDLVITDIFMPRMNGVELLKKIRSSDKDLPVILVTGFDAQDAKDAASEYNAYAILLKPFHLEDLKKLIDKALE